MPHHLQIERQLLLLLLELVFCHHLELGLSLGDPDLEAAGNQRVVYFARVFDLDAPDFETGLDY